jgi:TrpR family transcriptional regulator, trp operon repressor
MFGVYLILESASRIFTVTIYRNIIMNKNIKEVSKLLAVTEDPKEIIGFFESILTLNESKDIGNRWELVKRLDRGESQRKIAGDLHLSLCKITRGSKELKKKNSVLRRFLKKL